MPGRAASVKILRKREKVAKWTLKGFMACIDTIAPVWNFLFIKKEDPDALSN